MTPSTATCDATQWGILRAFQDKLVDVLMTTSSRGSTMLSRNGNGAYIFNTHTHCQMRGDSFFEYTMSGISASRAVSAWWESVNEPALRHTYICSKYFPEAC